VVDRDHRIVAWAPGGDGLVEIRRAPTSGTAVNATTVFGSDRNPATPARKARMQRKRLRPRPPARRPGGATRVTKARPRETGYEAAPPGPEQGHRVQPLLWKSRGGFAGDRQERDMNRTSAVHVTFPLITATSQGLARSAERSRAGCADPR
jgi:hypothetical protein